MNHISELSGREHRVMHPGRRNLRQTAQVAERTGPFETGTAVEVEMMDMAPVRQLRREVG